MAAYKFTFIGTGNMGGALARAAAKSLPGAEILQFSQEGVEPVSYRDTEHYQITRRFLEDPDRMLRYLLKDE